ncbi:nephronectin isoform X2 [Aquila chrysaetos chrysaetos]|uniref:nephronectin isoform X2 n=1 Tax=Aquila chrysaetos chrysaetos TaxID=223781 RepID=UPI0011772B8A|nr:nephronectin isoform X2 [Aquila chrysaetos chrysaetos]
MELSLRLLLASCISLGAAGEFDRRWPRQIVSSAGLCRFGSRIDCCWGWARLSWGQCQPICQPGCKHGECVGPNKCKCHPGYTGKTCNQDEQLSASPPGQSSAALLFRPLDHHARNIASRDLNECGLKPRPCKHRCMNTYGSYKCYCLNGYMLMPDGTCSNALSCSMANCQYGCDVLKGEVRCRCPSPGLQLGPDGRTCIDIDECATGRVICPRFRHCVNTFGSYICRCHKGFDLMYIGGKYQCHDIDECSLGHHQCGSFSRCYNTPGSYKCKCKEGYRDNGTNCILIPNVMIEPPGPYHIFKGNSTLPKGGSGITNRIPDVGGTRQPLRPPYVPAIVTERPVTRPTTRPTPRPTTRLTAKPTTRYVPVTTRPVTRPPPPPPPQPTTLRPTLPPQRTPLITTEEPSHVPIETTSSQGIRDDNRIQIDPQKPRGDVFIPRQPGVSNNLFEILEIERGITADEFEANDDPGVLVHSCNFDSGLCGWIKDRDDDLHWEPVRDASGGQYLTISDPKGKEGRVAHLILPLGHMAQAGDLCLSFRHKVPGLHSGALQVFVRKNGAHGPAIWGRNGGHGWRRTHITLRGLGIKSVIFKGEKGKGRTGDIGLDDVILRRGRCSEEH